MCGSAMIHHVGVTNQVWLCVYRGADQDGSKSAGARVPCVSFCFPRGCRGILLRTYAPMQSFVVLPISLQVCNTDELLQQSRPPDENRFQTTNCCSAVDAAAHACRKADKICVVHAGKVTEEGSHDDLVSKPDSRYKVLVDAAERRGGSMAM